jgi:hypothetical protein
MIPIKYFVEIQTLEKEITLDFLMRNRKTLPIVCQKYEH